ncbi:hypothetical protein Pelo_15375 [Pelomyxa schiedti]|nr:hypothetical protein Pelo_15375 [Pelomyxa schiedti]
MHLGRASKKIRVGCVPGSSDVAAANNENLPPPTSSSRGAIGSGGSRGVDVGDGADIARNMDKATRQLQEIAAMASNFVLFSDGADFIPCGSMPATSPSPAPPIPESLSQAAAAAAASLTGPNDKVNERERDAKSKTKPTTKSASETQGEGRDHQEESEKPGTTGTTNDDKDKEKEEDESNAQGGEDSEDSNDETLAGKKRGPPEAEPDIPTTVIVKNIPPEYTADDLKKRFHDVPKVLNIRVLPSMDKPGTNRGFAFIELGSLHAAKNIIYLYNRKTFGFRNLIVEITKKKPYISSDLTCWNCGEKDHNRDNCPKPLIGDGHSATVCSQCGAAGHTKMLCPQKPKPRELSRPLKPATSAAQAATRGKIPTKIYIGRRRMTRGVDRGWGSYNYGARGAEGDQENSTAAAYANTEAFDWRRVIRGEAESPVAQVMRGRGGGWGARGGTGPANNAERFMRGLACCGGGTATDTPAAGGEESGGWRGRGGGQYRGRGGRGGGGGRGRGGRGGGGGGDNDEGSEWRGRGRGRGDGRGRGRGRGRARGRRGGDDGSVGRNQPEDLAE